MENVSVEIINNVIYVIQLDFVIRGPWVSMIFVLTFEMYRNPSNKIKMILF